MLDSKTCASLLGFLWILSTWGGNVFAGHSEQSQAKEYAPDAGKVWRVANKCAVNALYVTLRLYGRDVRYEELEASLPVGSNGSSLPDLRDSAARFGLKTRIVKLTPDELSQCRLPLIAHSEEEKKISGHYVVVAAVSPQGVEVIDGTSGIISTVPPHRFARDWSGYALVVDDRPLWHLLFPAAILLGAGAICLAIYVHVRDRRLRLHESVAQP